MNGLLKATVLSFCAITSSATIAGIEDLLQLQRPDGVIIAEQGLTGSSDRSTPCVLGPSNTYDAPPAGAPMAAMFVGQVGASRFYLADDFTPGANATLTRLCWRGTFSDAACNVSAAVSPHEWHVNIYAFDSLTALPSALIASRSTLPGGNMTVVQKTTGAMLPCFGGLEEVVFSATITGVGPLLAGTCYYAEIYHVGTPATCDFLALLSYEPTLNPAAEGDRLLLRRDDVLAPAYSLLDFVNFDAAISFGFAGGQPLAPSNSFGSCFDNPIPFNDVISTAQIVACGGTINFNNTYATHTAALDPVACRKNMLAGNDYTAGDVWFRFNPNPQTSTRVSLETSGPPALDALITVFRLTNTGNPASITNLTAVGCSDDSCGVLPRLDLFNLNALPNGGANQNFYVRIASFSPLEQGDFTLTVSCPVAIGACNDVCGGATLIPDGTPQGCPVGYRTPGGITHYGQTQAATPDTIEASCGGFGNAANGVWFKLVGRGTRLLARTLPPLNGVSPVDTQLSVYCGSCMPGGGGLSCIAFNNAPGSTESINFCGRSGVTYYLLVNAALAASGNFGLVVEEIGPACADVQPCGVPACCLGNADKVAPGSVNFGDVTSVLANFNAAYPATTGPGDADCSGLVNFSDITSVLANFLNVCP